MRLSDDMRQLCQNFLEGYDGRVAAVVGIRTETAQELAEFHTARQVMSAEQRQRLSEQADELRRDTAALLEGLDAAHQDMATEQRQRLNEQVDELRRSTAGFLKELDATHQDMAAGQREWLAAARARLASDGAAMRGELQADLSGAHRLWGGFNLLMRQRRAKKPAAPPPPPPPVKKKVVAPPPPVKVAPPPPPVEEVAPPPPIEKAPRAKEVAPDDLTTIRGIGPSMQKHLNEAGIYTYAQLATGTPDELRQTLGAVARLAKVEEWIEQARELALG